MFGGFHNEKHSFKAIEVILYGSRWTQTLTEAGVGNAGTRGGLGPKEPGVPMLGRRAWSPTGGPRSTIKSIYQMTQNLPIPSISDNLKRKFRFLLVYEIIGNS